jgi:hypothetical protein
MWVENFMQTRENMRRAWMHTTTAAYQLPGISPEGVVKKQYIRWTAIACKTANFLNADLLNAGMCTP